MQYKFVIIFLILTTSFSMLAQKPYQIPEWYLEKIFNTDEPGYLEPFAFEILVESENGKSFLLKKLRSEEKFVKQRAIILLGYFGDEELIYTLKKYYNSSETSISSASMISITSILRHLGTVSTGNYLSQLRVDSELDLQLSELLCSFLENFTESSSVVHINKFLNANKQKKINLELFKKTVSLIKQYNDSDFSRRELIIERLSEFDLNQSNFEWSLTKIYSSDSLDTQLLSGVKDIWEKKIISVTKNDISTDIKRIFLKLRRNLNDNLTSEETTFLQNTERKLHYSGLKKDDFVKKLISREIEPYNHEH